MFEHRDVVISHLRIAEDALRTASLKATEAEGERRGLQGETALLIGGLGQAVNSLADVLLDGLPA